MISFKDYCKRVNESTVISEDNPYMWKIEGGKGKGKEFGHKSTTVDDHLSAMNYHNAEYQKAMKEKRDSDARHHGMKYHKHKDQIERLGSAGSYLKDSVELDESANIPVDKVNDGLKAIGVKPHHIATLAARIKPAQYAEQAESVIVEAIKGWKHAHTDIMKSRSAASAASKPIQLRRLTSKGVESKMSSTEQSAFSSHEDAQKHVDNMHQMNPGKKFSYNKYVDGKHVGVVTKSANESVELDESTFVSDSPSTGASRGVKFDVQKNKEKSTGEHANGQPKEHHDVYHEGKHVGHVASYSGYKDKKAPGARIVSSRKDVRLWQATIHSGEHNRHGSVFNTTPASSQYYHDGFTSKKDALQHLADAHNSNKNR